MKELKVFTDEIKYASLDISRQMKNLHFISKILDVNVDKKGIE